MTPIPRLLTISSPVTGDVLGTVPDHDADAVRAAAERGRRAQPAWEALGTHARAARVRRWARAAWAARESLFEQIRAETGKTTGGAYIEVAIVDAVAEYYARFGPGWLKPQRRTPLFTGLQKTRVHFPPFPLVGFVTPWNYPYMNGIVDVIPALIAGSAVVIKPSEKTPFTMLRIARDMHAAGIPADIVQVVTGGPATGEAVVDCADMIAVTGSSATGRAVAARAAQRLIPTSLELGGKGPLIVLSDADADRAAAGALMGAFENAGQACISIERAYIESGIYDMFIERVLAWYPRLALGPQAGFGVHVGSLTHTRELERTEAHIADALAHGAHLLAGGRRRPDLGPLFFEPAVLTGCTPDMRVMREETFGPVLPIMRVADADEAVCLANTSDYGLSATLYTRDLRRGERLAARLQCGDVSINRPQVVFGTVSAPMGGQKQSGIGRRGGIEGLMRFTQPQTISTLPNGPFAPQLEQADPTTRRLYAFKRVLARILPI
jgi:acyl-CoA reductase-like NAD-dependent aldehyde dehydrogenase